MQFRSVLFASVCTALLAASAAVSGASAGAKSAASLAVSKAYKALAAGKSKQAIAIYSEAIESRELAPALLANALLNRALAHQRLQQHQDAIDDYSAAMRVDAMSASLRAVALYNRGLSQQKVDKSALAIEDFTSALFLNVEFPQAYLSRGNALRSSGKYLFALSDYEKALKYKHPSPHLAHYGQALVFETLNRPLNAQKALVRALTANPGFMPARKKLSQMIDADGNPPAPSLPGTASMRPQVRQAGFFQPTPADGIVTGSIVAGNPDLVVSKANLPAAVSPPKGLLVNAVATDRPARGEPTRLVSAPAVVQPAAAKVVADAPEAKAEKAAHATPTQAGLSGWTIQLSSQKNEDAAWSHWKKLQERHKSTLRGQEARVVMADLGSKGIYYRLRVNGIDNKKTALNLCQKLKRRGTSCFVSHAKS